jgi:DNA-binding NarL/FixJ family response regulator
MSITVTIADDHRVVAEGLQRMLEGQPKITIYDVCMNGNQLMLSLEKRLPDVLLLDIQMPGTQGDELAKIITEKYPQVTILTLTNLNQSFHVRNMFLNGARGYLLKSADQFMLIEAIETVHMGNQYIDPSLREQMLHDMLDERAKANSIPVLTQREKEILELIASEYTSAQIGKKLFLSLSTVENHRINIFFKLGVKNVAGLVRKAIQLGIIRADQ